MTIGHTSNSESRKLVGRQGTWNLSSSHWQSYFFTYFEMSGSPTVPPDPLLIAQNNRLSATSSLPFFQAMTIVDSCSRNGFKFLSTTKSLSLSVISFVLCDIDVWGNIKDEWREGKLWCIVQKGSRESKISC